MTHHTLSRRTVLTYAGMVFTWGAVASSNGLAAPKKKQAAQVAPPPAHYGPFTISNIGQFSSSQSKATGKIPLQFDGPQLSAKSSRYDIAAPHITIILIKAGTPARLSAQTVSATGGVTVVLRNPDNDETTKITGDRANYVATNAAKQLGRLTITGNVRTVTRGPAYGDTPLIQSWTSFYVEFVDEDTTNYGGEKGNVSGAIREPAPRKKASGAQQ